MKSKEKDVIMKKETERFICFVLAGLFGLAIIVLLTAVLCSCATEQLAKNLEQKSIVGDGFLAISKITVTDPEAGDLTPMVKTVIVNGQLQTILKDANLLTYTRNSSASVFNASSVTTTETLTISLPSTGNMADTLKQAGAVIRNNEATATTNTETAATAAAEASK